MTRNPHLLAHFQHGTSRALWALPRANVFAKRNQQAIDIYPMTLGKDRFECDHRFFRCGGLDVTPTVGDPMDVDVHADVGLAASDAQHKVGALRSDARKRLQDFGIARQIPVELFDDTVCDLVDLLCFALVEGAVLNQSSDLPG